MGLGALRTAARGRLGLFGRWPIAGQAEPSLIAPMSDAPSERLLDVALAAVAAARTLDLDWLSSRTRGRLAEVWPGEHYRLLAALVSVLQPKLVIEIGTWTGVSALAMKASLPGEGRIVTFDVHPWREHADAVLRAEDFADGRLEQRTEDLSTPTGWRANSELLQGAELVFLDAKHDGHQERAFLRGFEEVGLASGPIVVLDDIRVWGMLAFWREIGRPKLDLTSFGHWSGTGLVDYGD